MKHTTGNKPTSKEKNMNIYVIQKDKVEQTKLGTFSTAALAEDMLYRHVTKEIRDTNKSFHTALRAYTVALKTS
jgi:hypothetical protein